MAQALASERFCTLTRYVQLNVDSVLVLHIHTLPENEDGTGSTVAASSTSVGLPTPYSWLEDKHMQELMVMVHEIVQEKVMKELSLSCDSTNNKKKKTVNKKTSSCGHSDHELKRGRSLRVLFNFKSHHIRQHIALPTDPVASPLLPLASTFVTEQGRIVFESSGFITSGGDYKSFSVLSDSLHVFIDRYDPTSHHGVIKILMLLDPNRSKCRDVLTYFQPLQKKRNSNNSSSSSSNDGDEEEERGGLLEDLPVERLKRRHRGGAAGTRGRGGSSRQGRQKKGSNHRSTSKKEKVQAKLTKIHKQNPSPQVRLSSQPTIINSLTTTATSARQTTDSPALPPPQSSRTQTQKSPGIDELFGMDSQWLSGDEEKIDDIDIDNQNVDDISSSSNNSVVNLTYDTNSRDAPLTTSNTCLYGSNTPSCNSVADKVDTCVVASSITTAVDKSVVVSPNTCSSMCPRSCFSVETPSSLLNLSDDMMEEKTDSGESEDKHTRLESQVILHSPEQHTLSSQVSLRRYAQASQASQLSPRIHKSPSQVSPRMHNSTSLPSLRSPRRHSPSSQVSLDSPGRIKRSNKSLLSLRSTKNRQHTHYSKPDEISLVAKEIVSSPQTISNMVHLISGAEEEEEDDEDGLPDIMMNKTHTIHSHITPSGDPMDCVELIAKEAESVKWQGSDKADRETAGTVALEKRERARVIEVREGVSGEGLDVAEIERKTVEMKYEHIERMNTLSSNSSKVESVEQDGRSDDNMSPELWTENPDSASFTGSQPLEDITNTTKGVITKTDTASSNSRVKTCLAQQWTLEECFKESTTAPTNTDSVDLADVIVLSSDDDECSTSQQTTSQQGEGDDDRVKKKKQRKKKRIVNPEILFRGIKEICDIPVQRVSQWLAQQKQILVDILLQRHYSRRNDTFITGARNRAALQHQISAHRFNKEQIDLITNSLMRVFCSKNMDYFSYVMSVLYPECLIRLIMDFHSIPFEQAERVMMGLDEICSETELL